MTLAEAVEDALASEQTNKNKISLFIFISP
jgi:hypothetical protein